MTRAAFKALLVSDKDTISAEQYASIATGGSDAEMERFRKRNLYFLRRIEFVDDAFLGVFYDFYIMFRSVVL